jgi:hypothetical protein
MKLMPARIKSAVFLLVCAGALATGIIAGSFGDLRAALLLEIAYIVGAFPGALVVLTWKGKSDEPGNLASKGDGDFT